MLGGFVTGILLEAAALCPTASHVYNLMDALRASSIVVSALSRKDPRRPANQNLEVGYQAQGELTTVIMIRRYNRFWTKELLLELRDLPL